ncbi:acetyl-coenzyme A carboxylase carboxyl transferase subunit beta [Clostridia bacterium]|nr:acetyl-coenzyme A carboxylase carboxyl transferase subunit beta [Clostridia bacterium]
MDIFNIFSQRRNILDALKNTRRKPKTSAAFSARERLDKLLDAGSAELFLDIPSRDPIEFPNYGEKLSLARAKTGLNDAYCCREGTIAGRRVIAAALEPAFMMGSMGTAVGEAITRSAERARDRRLPLIIFSASGGARMQEGMFSLMQMAKTSAAIRAFSDGGGLFISVLTHPTTGGVTASFASLGDIILAEPGALIGFAGPRVIEQTIGEKLPEGFQRAEFQLAHGFVDAIVPRGEMRSALVKLLKLHPEKRAAV